MHNRLTHFLFIRIMAVVIVRVKVMIRVVFLAVKTGSRGNIVLLVLVIQQAFVEVVKNLLRLHGEVELLVVEPVEPEVALHVALVAHDGLQWNICLNKHGL